MNPTVEAVAAVPTGFKVWWMAIRPRTLVAGIIPVMVGHALAIRAGKDSTLVFLVALAWMVLQQIGCNLHNDYFDFKHGADTTERVGPVRVTQSGLISARTVLLASLGFFAGGIAFGGYLIHLGGTPAVVMALIVLVGLYAYTGGPLPLAYLALGDVVVFTCFGLLPTVLTFYAQSLELHPLVWLVALPPATLAGAILCVNNLRDVTTDGKAGKRTTIVLLGTGFGRAMYVTHIAVAALVPVGLWLFAGFGPSVLLPLLALPFVRHPLRLVLKETGSTLNAALGMTARFEGIFGLLLAIGLILDR
jgi:1,4-dihydroxy-2-naphthoate polyprenyltransferase